MTLDDAANICRPLDGRTFQDQTLDLADKLIGEVNARNAKLEEEANVDGVFRSASYTLEAAAVNLRAYSRGMVAKEVLPTYLRQAEEAIAQMRAAIS